MKNLIDNVSSNSTEIYRKQLAIRRKDLPKLLGISPSTLDGLLNPKSPYYIPDFPPSIQLGVRTRVWLVNDIIAYLERKRELTPDIEGSAQD